MNRKIFSALSAQWFATFEIQVKVQHLHVNWSLMSSISPLTSQTLGLHWELNILIASFTFHCQSISTQSLHHQFIIHFRVLIFAMVSYKASSKLEAKPTILPPPSFNFVDCLNRLCMLTMSYYFFIIYLFVRHYKKKWSYTTIVKRTYTTCLRSSVVLRINYNANKFE